MTRIGLVHPRLSLPWVFEAAERLGIDVVLVPRADDDLSALPSSVVDVVHADVLTGPEDAVRSLGGRRLDGLLTMFDPAVPFTAMAAEKLGLPGIASEVADRVTDKGAVHRSLEAAGANTAGSATLTAPWQVPDVRFPVVVKPAAGYSSMGVVRVDDAASLPGELDRVFALAVAGLSPEAAARGLVVEEYIDGPEYAVESFVWQGHSYIHSIGDKGQPVGPYFEEGIYRAPAPLDAPTRAAIEAQVRLANQAVGIEQGPVHTELRLRPDGKPFVFDIGARVGGSGVSHFIVRHSTGIDFLGNALRAAVGIAPVGLVDDPPIAGYAGNYIVPNGGSGVVEEISGLADVGNRPCVEHISQFLFPGDIVRPYPEFSGYPAFVLSRHPTAEEMLAFHEDLAENVVVRYQVP